jgi:hypothetical protein
VSSGVAEKVEDIGTEEPAVTGLPVCKHPVATAAFEEHLTVIVLAQIFLKQHLLQPKDPWRLSITQKQSNFLDH